PRPRSPATTNRGAAQGGIPPGTAQVMPGGRQVPTVETKVGQQIPGRAVQSKLWVQIAKLPEPAQSPGAAQVVAKVASEKQQTRPAPQAAPLTQPTLMPIGQAAGSPSGTHIRLACWAQQVCVAPSQNDPPHGIPGEPRPPTPPMTVPPTPEMRPPLPPWTPPPPPAPVDTPPPPPAPLMGSTGLSISLRPQAQ